jgi:hypothetical protein
MAGESNVATRQNGGSVSFHAIKDVAEAGVSTEWLGATTPQKRQGLWIN